MFAASFRQHRPIMRISASSINLRQKIDTREWSSQPSRTLETVAEYTFDENESFHTPL